MVGKIVNLIDNIICIRVTGKTNLKLDDNIIFHKQQPRRRMKQNNFYWAYLNWCIDNGLKSQGHYSADALHENIKEWIKEKHGNKYNKIDFSTSDLNVVEFSEYIMIVDLELMQEFFEINTSGFYATYDQFKMWSDQTGGSWQEYIGVRQ